MPGEEGRVQCGYGGEEGEGKGPVKWRLVTLSVGGFGQQSGLCESPFLFYFHLLGPCYTPTVHHPQRQERMSLLSLLFHPFIECLH